MAFARLEPFGPLQDDYRAGLITSATYAPYMKKPPTPADLFPSLKPDGQTKGMGLDEWAGALRAEAAR